MPESRTYRNWKRNLKSGWTDWTRRQFQNEQWYQNYKIWERKRKRKRGDTNKQIRRKLQRIESIRRNFDEDALCGHGTGSGPNHDSRR